MRLEGLVGKQIELATRIVPTKLRRVSSIYAPERKEHRKGKQLPARFKNRPDFPFVRPLDDGVEEKLGMLIGSDI
jgi:hypothetical protein